MSLIFYYSMHYLIYHYLPSDKHIIIMPVSINTVFLHDSFVLFSLESLYTKSCICLLNKVDLCDPKCHGLDKNVIDILL